MSELLKFIYSSKDEFKYLQNGHATVSSFLTGEDISFFHVSQSVYYHVWRSHYWILF